MSVYTILTPGKHPQISMQQKYKKTLYRVQEDLKYSRRRLSKFLCSRIRGLYFWQNFTDGSKDPAASNFRVDKKKAEFIKDI